MLTMAGENTTISISCFLEYQARQVLEFGSVLSGQAKVGKGWQVLASVGLPLDWVTSLILAQSSCSCADQQCSEQLDSGADKQEIGRKDLDTQTNGIENQMGIFLVTDPPLDSFTPLIKLL